MDEQELLPHLFRTEYRKIISVLCALFGIEHVGTAEDIASDTFLSAAEIWGLKGLPENPVAWLYTVAKNKTRNYLKRDTLFAGKLSADIRHTSPREEEIGIDFSEKSIQDSQLAMIFTVCDPSISREAQVALALKLLCGFGVQEIADAFLTSREVIYKRLSRATDKLRHEKIKIEQPTHGQVSDRLESVLTTLYLLFNEGYYSTSGDTLLRKDLCQEAMRLTGLLTENEQTNTPPLNALFALMCFHSSRFEARTNELGEPVLYGDQDTRLWDRKMIETGEHHLNLASRGSKLSKYHIEAGIAYWHTHPEDTKEKWENILQLYNQLLMVAYSPIVALNRTFALAKANGKQVAITEAEKLNLTDNPFYYSLLGSLYENLDNIKALEYLRSALVLARSESDRIMITRNIERITG
jgi:RNA polymerase sigma-70 factor (ECF subfamily)